MLFCLPSPDWLITNGCFNPISVSPYYGIAHSCNRYRIASGRHLSHKMAASVLECIMLYYLQKYIILCKVSTLVVVISDGYKICTSDHIALYGLWLYRFHIRYKYLQVIQPFVGINLRFWYDKCMLKLKRSLLTFWGITWSWVTNIYNLIFI